MGRCASGLDNGELPDDALAAVSGAPGHRMRADAALAVGRLITVWRDDTGETAAALTDSYRDFATQVLIRQTKGHLVATATPGTSRHGCGEAIDARPQFWGWLINTDAGQTSAADNGLVWPAWARKRGTKSYEPWHHEYHPDLDDRFGEAPQKPGFTKEDSVLKVGDGSKNGKAAQVSDLQRVINGALARSANRHGKVAGVAVDGEFGADTATAYEHARLRAQMDFGVDWGGVDVHVVTPIDMTLLATYVLHLGDKI